MKTNVLDCVISSVLSQLASETKPNRVVIKINLSQEHPVVFFSKKMISAKI